MSGQIPVGPMQFNPMGTGQVSNPLAGSIDALFNAYKLAKQTQLQNAQIPGIQAATQAQVLANQGTAFQQAAAANDYAATHYGYSPQQLAQGFQGSYVANPDSNSVYGAPQAPAPGPAQNAMAPVQQTQPAPSGNPVGQPLNPNVPSPLQWGQGQPQMAPQGPQGAPQIGSGPFGHKSPQEAAQSLQQFAQMGQQLGAQNALANLSKTQAEAGKAGAEADLTEAQVKMLGGSGAMIDNYVNQISQGKMSLDDLSSLGRGELANAIKVGVGAKLAAGGVNVAALDNQIKASGAGLSSKASSTAKVQGGDTQEIGTIAGVVEDTLNSAAPLVKALNDSGKIAAINAAFLQGKKALNDPQSTALLTKLNILKNRYAVVSAYPNAPTPAQQEDIAKLISDGMTSGSFGAMGDAMKQEGRSIVARAGGAGYSQPNPNPATPAIPASPAAQPITRTLRNGQVVKVIPLGGGRFQAVP